MHCGRSDTAFSIQELCGSHVKSFNVCQQFIVLTWDPGIVYLLLFKQTLIKLRDREGTIYELFIVYTVCIKMGRYLDYFYC